MRVGQKFHTLEEMAKIRQDMAGMQMLHCTIVTIHLY